MHLNVPSSSSQLLDTIMVGRPGHPRPAAVQLLQPDMLLNHGVHAAEPGLLEVPLGQVVQVALPVAPATLLAVPAGHSLQPPPLVAPYVPGAQGTQPVRLALLP